MALATILRMLTPKSQPLPASPFVSVNVDGSSTLFENVTYTGTPLEIPQTAKIASITFLEANAVSQLVANYALVPSVNTTGFWRGPTHTLSLVTQINQYSLTLNEHAHENPPIVNLEAAKGVASDFVKTYFPSSDLKLLESKVSYSSDDHGRQTEPENALYVTLPFSYQIDGYEVNVGAASLKPLSITVNGEGEIQKVAFFPQTSQLEATDVKGTLTISEALKNINFGNASITRAFQEDFQAFNIRAIKSAQLETVTLEYRLDEALRLAYPFYHFYGTATDDQGVRFTIEILTPAIAVGPQTN